MFTIKRSALEIRAGGGNSDSAEAGSQSNNDTMEVRMDRREVIRNLERDLETLARLHVQHGLHHTEGFQNQMERIASSVREHEIDTRKELDPLARSLYRRYFG